MITRHQISTGFSYWFDVLAAMPESGSYISSVATEFIYEVSDFGFNVHVFKTSDHSIDAWVVLENEEDFAFFTLLYPYSYVMPYSAVSDTVKRLKSMVE